MTNYDPNLRGVETRDRFPSAGWNSGSWIAGAVIAILLLIGIGYVFSGRSSTTGTVEHRAAATDTMRATPPTASTPSVVPAPTPTTAPAAPSKN